MANDRVGGRRGVPAPPMHPSSPSAPPPLAASSSSPRLNLPPPLPPRPSQSQISTTVSPVEEERDLGSEVEVENGSDTVGNTKDEEVLSDLQLLQLYNDEEINRFLHLFSTYVREVRIAEPDALSRSIHEASLSAPALAQSEPPLPRSPAVNQNRLSGSTSISERIALDLLLPLLPPPRPPLPDFSLSRLKQTSQRLYVAVEPLYSLLVVPLLKLATWKSPRKSFTYCALYWILWYHGFLLSTMMTLLLYQLVRWKVHPYPSLAELRELRARIDRADHFGSILSMRLVASPALGFQDMWELFGDYRRLRKVKTMAQGEADKKKNAFEAGGSLTNDDLDIDNASIRSGFYASTPDLTDEQSTREVEEADLKRFGLFLMNEVADLLERVKNVFLWRQPGASAYYGLVLMGCFILGLLPSRYLVKLVGFAVGGMFWHVTPVIAAIPPSQRDRLPSPFGLVPTDTEYAMELISQRVAHGLPVRPKRRPQTRDDSVVSASEREGASSSSVDWNKWGGRIVSTKERAGEIKQMFQDGQWKQPGNWKALNPLAPKAVSGAETRIEAHTFPAQLKQNPGLITLTQTTLYFIPIFSSRASLTIQLSDITGVKKTMITKGIDVHYAESREDGGKEDKEVNFVLVGSRTDLFARLVSLGGKKWAKVT